MPFSAMADFRALRGASGVMWLVKKRLAILNYGASGTLQRSFKVAEVEDFCLAQMVPFHRS